MLKLAVAGALALVLISLPAAAQTADDPLDGLSSGNRKIALALYDRQSAGDGAGEAWSMEKILAAREDGAGWGQIFKRMKAEDLIAEKNLGQLIALRQRPNRPRSTIAASPPPGVSSPGASPPIASPGPSVAVAGAYKRLSPGNRRIAEALFERQVLDADGTIQAWSLDRIAATKQSGASWGRVFRRMKTDGIVAAKSLGQVISGHMRPGYSRPAPATVVITSGKGSQTIVAVRRSRTEPGADGRRLGLASRAIRPDKGINGVRVVTGVGNAFGAASVSRHAAIGSGGGGRSAGRGLKNKTK